MWASSAGLSPTDAPHCFVSLLSACAAGVARAAPMATTEPQPLAEPDRATPVPSVGIGIGRGCEHFRAGFVDVLSPNDRFEADRDASRLEGRHETGADADDAAAAPAEPLRTRHAAG